MVGRIKWDDGVELELEDGGENDAGRVDEEMWINPKMVIPCFWS